VPLPRLWLTHAPTPRCHQAQHGPTRLCAHCHTLSTHTPLYPLRTCVPARSLQSTACSSRAPAATVLAYAQVSSGSVQRQCPAKAQPPATHGRASDSRRATSAMSHTRAITHRARQPAHNVQSPALAHLIHPSPHTHTHTSLRHVHSQPCEGYCRARVRPRVGRDHASAARLARGWPPRCSTRRHRPSRPRR